MHLCQGAAVTEEAGGRKDLHDFKFILDRRHRVLPQSLRDSSLPEGAFE